MITEHQHHKDRRRYKTRNAGRTVDPVALCRTESAIRAEAAGVTLEPLPLRRAVCLPHPKGSISSLWEKIKPAHRLRIKTAPLRFPFMKYLSSLAGEISILMAHQAQLSQIMKIHFHCQSAAVRWGWLQAD